MASSKKTMDVSKPGKVPADATARPLIVSHRPMVQDPMVKQETDTTGLEESKEPSEVRSSPTSGEKVIKPLDHSGEDEASEVEKAAEAAVSGKAKAETSSEKNDTETPSKDAEKSDDAGTAVESNASKEENTMSSKDEQVLTEADTSKNNTASPTSSSEAAVVDAVLDQGDTGKHKNDQEAEQQAQQEAAKREHLQKLIESKKYFVKTGQVARRRNNRIAIIFLVLIMLVIGLYLAVDAKLIQPGFDVPIHVIHT